MKYSFVERTKSEGFTLVETLVAIAVLLLVIIGPISAAQKGIQQAYYANEQLSAVFIAQETIEAIRQRRDDLALEAWADPSINTSEWDDSENCDNSPGPLACEVEKDGIAYIRSINIDPGSGDDWRHVTVTIGWVNRSLFGGQPRSVVLQTYLYDHYKRFGQ